MEWLYGSARESAVQRIGTTVGEAWHLDALLSHDRLVSVYRSTHADGQRATVKVIEIDVDDAPLGQRLVRAHYTGNRIAHPGVPTVLEEGFTAEGMRYLVIEHLEGETVEYLARRGRRDETFVLTLLDDVLGVLVAAHARGIVHGGLQPSHLFLTTAGSLKVLGFEVAGLREGACTDDTNEADPRPEACVGAPAFQPPEQALGRWADVDATSDLWSLAATAATVLLGRRLRSGDTASDDLFAAMTEPVAPMATLLPGISNDMARLLDRALAFHRDARFPHAMAMRGAVQAAFDRRMEDDDDAPDTLRAPTFPASSTRHRRETPVLSTTLTPHVWPTGDTLLHADESSPSPLAQSERPWTPVHPMFRSAVAESLRPRKNKRLGSIVIGTALGVAMGLAMVFVVGPRTGQADSKLGSGRATGREEAPPLRSPPPWQAPLRASPSLPLAPPLPLAFHPQETKGDAGAPSPTATPSKAEL